MRQQDTSDTIFALSSAPGRAGIAVIRVSGAQCAACVEALTGQPCPAPRQAVLRRFRDAEGGAIDRGLLLWFPGPDSFTGEDLAEFHVHGGRAVIQAVLENLSGQVGCRIAEPGEFTRRAFDAGKLDLAEVEGLADLIAADTEVQRRQALRQLEGGLSGRIEDWTARLTEVLAHVEAEIEFPDEELDGGLAPGKLELVAETERLIVAALDDRGIGERLREGFSAVLLGAPNVGKSSLMNRLARRDVAIVAEQAGTTRDVIEIALDLSGYPLTLADTAGLRSAAEADAVDPVEGEGMRRSLARAEAADLKIFVRDATAQAGPLPGGLSLDDEDTLVVSNKCDLLDAPRDGCLGLSVSAKTGEGLDALIEALRARLAILAEGGGESAIVTRARHRQALHDCREALTRAQAAGDLELVAEDLRLALRALGRIVGRVDVEDILDVVFRDFCIGK